MRHGSSIVAGCFALTILAPSMLLGQGVLGLSIGNYEVVSEQRLSRTESSVTYRAELVNTGVARPGVTATVKSLAAGVQVVPGQGTLHFAPVPANSRLISTETFTILIDRSIAIFDFSNLQWSFLSPVANAGPNQTVAVGSTVFLNGTASSNPAAVGTLSYAWTFAARPAGSKAVIANANSVLFASFVVDVPGNYVITLTISNGQAKDSRNVTISTVNSPPVAKAGPNQTVPAGSAVVLNGGGSSDVDGDPLTYFWSMLSQPPGRPELIVNFRSVQASFTASKPGTYIVQLVVGDGKFESASTVTVTTENTPPVANAGLAKSGGIGVPAQLNGSASTDADGDALIYKWSLITLPANSTAAFNNASAVNPFFTPDLPGTYVAQLIVNDGKVDSAPATVTITTSSTLPPTANAGPNQTVVHGTTVTLNGSGTDPQNLPLTLAWSMISRPAGSAAILSNENTSNPTFVADRPGNYIAQLIVNNGVLSSAPSTVTIATTNSAPVAAAGPPQNVAVGFTVALDGGGSSDADNDPLTYSWSLLSRPTGSTAALSAPNSKTPTFAPDLAGTYVVQLIVSDGLASHAATVLITASPLRIGLTPSPLNLVNSPGTLTISLNSPAGAGGVTVTLSGFDSNIVSVSPVAVLIPENSTTATVTVTPAGAGTTFVLATGTGYQPGTGTVNVTNPAITITLNAPGVGVTRTVNGTVSLSAPAPPGGTVVSLSADPNGVVQLISDIIIQGGGSTGGFTLTGLSEGSATITATSPGYAAGTASVLVAKLGAIALASGVEVAVEQKAVMAVFLSTPAPAGGVTIMVESNNEKVQVPQSVFIPQGALVPSMPLIVTGVDVGTAVITVTAIGYRGDTQPVKVTAKLP